MAEEDGTRKGKKARDPNRWTQTEERHSKTEGGVTLTT